MTHWTVYFDKPKSIISKKFTIHRLTSGNQDLKHLLDKCFDNPNITFLSGSNIYAMSFNNSFILLAALSRNYISFVPSEIWTTTSFYVYNVCCDPKFRGLHLMEKLITCATMDLKNMLSSEITLFLIVNTKNLSAIKLYTRMSFTCIKTIYSGTPDFEPAYLMQKKFIKE